MHKFLKTHNLLRLNQEETENLNKWITCKETDSVIKNLPAYKSPEPDSVTGEFYQRFREELIPIYLSQTLPKNRR